MIHRHSNEIHLRQVTTLLRRRWLLICFAGLLGGGLAAAVAFLLEPTYTAKAQLLYEVEVGDGAVTDDSAGIDTLVEMLISPNHIRNLAASLAEDPGPAAPEPVETEGNDAADAAEGDPGAAPVPDYDQLTEGLNAYREAKSRLIAVTFTATDPHTAALVANRAAQLYLYLEAKFQRERQARATGLIADRIPDSKDELDRAESALRAHQIKFGLSNAPGTDASDRQIADLNRQLGLTRSDLAQRQADLDRLRATYDGARRQTDPGSPPESGKDPVDGLRLASGEATAHPASKTTLQRMTLDRDAAEARMRDIEERLSTLRRASAEQTDSWTHFRELKREAGAAGQVYENLLRRHDDMLGENGVHPSARLITTASLPDAPSSPNPLLFLAPAVVASLLLGGMLAILLERLDQRLRGERDVEEALGAPCIGLVPKVKRMRGTTLLALLRDQPFSSFTEAIRGVFVAATRPSAQGEQPKIFLITSCAGGEGKTTLAVSMGTYGARLGRRVLVIDMDFRNPNLLKILGETEANGVLEDRGAWTNPPEAAIRTAGESGVDYLSLPTTRLDPLSIIASHDFAQFLCRVRETYSCILIDSGPVADAAETPLLASMVDRVILTVRWGVTDARTGFAAMQHFRAAGGDVPIPVSVVINQVKLRAHRRYRYSEAFARPVGV